MSTYEVEGSSGVGGTLPQHWDGVAMWTGLNRSCSLRQDTAQAAAERGGGVTIRVFPPLSSHFDFLPMPSLAGSNGKQKARKPYGGEPCRCVCRDAGWGAERGGGLWGVQDRHSAHPVRPRGKG